MRKAVAVVALLAAGIGAYGYLGSRTGAFVPEVRTVTVTVGEVVDTVVATGSLEAVTTVQVGSQVSGIIRDLYVDYNSIVRAGDVIMRLDPSLFETQTEQARANLLRGPRPTWSGSRWPPTTRACSSRALSTWPRAS